MKFIKKINFYHKITLLLILIFLGSFLRVYNLENIYSTYDDVWPFLLHKGVEGSKSFKTDKFDQLLDLKLPFSLNASIDNPKDIKIHKSKSLIDFTLSEEEIHNLEKKLIFPFYVFLTSTYSPGQYLIYPLIFNKDDTLEKFKFKGRAVSVFFSISSLIILLLFLYQIKLKINLSYIFISSLFIFSNNEIMNAHHASPYSCYTFFTILGIFFLFLQIKKNLSFNQFLILNSLFCYFSYLNILFFLPALFIVINDLKKNSYILLSFKNYKYYLISLILLLPIVFLAILGTASIEFHNKLFESLFEYNNLFIIKDIHKIFNIITYLLNGNLNYYLKYLSTFLIILVISLTVFKLFYKKFKTTENILLLSLLIIIVQYITLYFLNKLPLIPTRHSSFFLPILLILLFLSFYKHKFVNYILFFYLLIFIPISFSKSFNKLTQLTTIFDYKKVTEYDFDKIYVFGETLDPLIQLNNYKVYNLDLKSVSTNFKSGSNSEVIVLISQHYKFNEWKKSRLFNQSLSNELNKYKIIHKIEKQSEHKISVIDEENGFYFYYLQKL